MTFLKVLLAVLLTLGMGSVQSFAQTKQPKALKFDELPMGIGTPQSSSTSNLEKAMKSRLQRYARQLHIERAQAFIIGYSPRIVQHEIYNRSYGEMRAGQAKEFLSAFFDYRRITTIDGGFREVPTTELWIVPPGAEPPRPTPSIKPDEVVRCPFLRVEGILQRSETTPAFEFKAIVESNDTKIRPTFEWRVSQGQIAKGQGTDTIRVEFPDGITGSIVATVNVIGYSLECPLNTTHGTHKIPPRSNQYLFDSFGDIHCEDELARLDNVTIFLQLQVHVVWYGGRVGLRNEALARATQMKNYLVGQRGIDAGRVFIIDGGYRNELSGELWFSDRGTAAPVLTPTVDKKYVRLKGRAKITDEPCSYGGLP
jgi:hypothetical protein